MFLFRERIFTESLHVYSPGVNMQTRKYGGQTLEVGTMTAQHASYHLMALFMQCLAVFSMLYQVKCRCRAQFRFTDVMQLACLLALCHGYTAASHTMLHHPSSYSLHHYIIAISILIDVYMIHASHFITTLHHNTASSYFIAWYKKKSLLHHVVSYFQR